MTARNQKRRHPGRNAALLLLAMLVIGFFLLRNTVFVVESVVVEGNSFRTTAEVIAQSGIQRGQSMLSVDANKVKQAINSDRYLRFRSLYRNFPTTIILRVTEVMPVATLTWLGMLITFDEQGIALDQTTQLDLDLQVPVVTGIQLESVQVGATVKTRNALQLETVLAVLAELRSQGALLEVSELNVADLDNMYLITQDGLQVQIGDSELLYDKLRLMRAALPSIRRMGAPVGGILNVTSGLTADYQLPQALWTPSPTASPSPSPT